MYNVPGRLFSNTPPQSGHNAQLSVSFEIPWHARGFVSLLVSISAVGMWAMAIVPHSVCWHMEWYWALMC